MGKYRYEQCIMGATLYHNDRYICTVSGMEDAERLRNLLDEKEDRIHVIESTLKELVSSVIDMDINKQKELIYLAQSLLYSITKR